MKVVIVGAGVIGAATALACARAGAQVTVIDAAGIAAGATGRSFGWINASFHADAAHFRLRAESMAAYGRLAEALALEAVAWPGCLCWEEQGAALDAQRDDLKALGYAVDEVDAAQFAALEPAVVPPARALFFRGEGVAEPGALAQGLIAAGRALGVRTMLGLRVQGIATQGDKVRGVETEAGVVPADRAVICGGTGSAQMLDSVGVALPMLRRPGLMLRSAPVPQVLTHILVAPQQEFRQDATGRIVAPTAASHQADARAEVEDRPDVLADAAIARLGALLPGVDLRWEEVALALRPVPQDGLPVIGACGPDGLYTAVMHSGITLAPLAAELLAAEVVGQGLSNMQADLVAPYRPDRFQSAMSKNRS